jgi:hypothetical protein
VRLLLAVVAVGVPLLSEPRRPSWHSKPLVDIPLPKTGIASRHD